jgi:hypothetical protein
MDKRIPNAEIRRVWLDLSLTTAAAAAQVGLSRSNLWRRAKELGLPARAKGRREVIPDDQLTALWNAGVLGREIAAQYDCHLLTVCQSARRLGLKKRPLGSRPAITMAEHRAGLIRAEMVAQARSEAVLRKKRLAAHKVPEAGVQP